MTISGWTDGLGGGAGGRGVFLSYLQRDIRVDSEP